MAAEPAQLTSIICAPLRTERAALARVLPAGAVRRTGAGPTRSAASAHALRESSAAVLVAGLGGAVIDSIAPGDVVVATEVRSDHDSVTCPSASILAGNLRRAGLTVHLGPIESRPSVVHGRARAGLAATGVIAVDMESRQLADAAGDQPFAVVRAIVDTPAHPLLRPGTVARGIKALGVLRAAAPVLGQWQAALGSRELVLAEPRSFCAGVSRAIEIVERSLSSHGAPVYVRRQIVHNAHVVAELESRGVVFVEELEEVPDGGLVVFAAHGVSPSVRAEAQGRDLVVIDATCPLVAKVHTEVKRYSSHGDTVFLIGHADHEEVVGTVGEAPDDVVVVADLEAAARVTPRDANKVAYVMQTTLAADEANQVADVLRQRFPSLNAPRRDDICYATTNRQLAVKAIAAEVELVLVVGSANSSNSRRLVEVAEREGAISYLIEDASDVRFEWLAGVRKIGITAGASAPPQLVDDLIQCLAGLGPVSVSSAHVADEDVQFTLPREVI